MILYQLSCGHGHEFEAWFRDGAAYDAQKSSGDVACPFCGDVDISKAPTAPNVLRSGRSRDNAEVRAKEVAEQILHAVNKLRRHIEDNCDYVGDEFAKEARRIHYGEADERSIYGEASDQEASDLEDEGIEYYKFPWLPRRDN